MEAELTMTITEQAPLEAVGAAVRGCSMGNGLDAERATRLQVVVEELCREARLREEVDGDGDLDISVRFDGSTITVEAPTLIGKVTTAPSPKVKAIGGEPVNMSSLVGFST